eukprot:TRINITY_DN7095_c0_g1_i1.p1 TRINITY_DN7095_c0_g1~~TRINITY_DN7095_c0_g1_i1.p1  ORF type:complete len:126 (-),score=11.46 TRINITY_DN7095_c0_g1_i1:6-383(-)
MNKLYLMLSQQHPSMRYHMICKIEIVFLNSSLFLWIKEIFSLGFAEKGLSIIFFIALFTSLILTNCLYSQLDNIKSLIPLGSLSHGNISLISNSFSFSFSNSLYPIALFIFFYKFFIRGCKWRSL